MPDKVPKKKNTAKVSKSHKYCLKHRTGRGMSKLYSTTHLDSTGSFIRISIGGLRERKRYCLWDVSFGVHPFVVFEWIIYIHSEYHFLKDYPLLRISNFWIQKPKSLTVPTSLYFFLKWILQIFCYYVSYLNCLLKFIRDEDDNHFSVTKNKLNIHKLAFAETAVSKLEHSW